MVAGAATSDPEAAANALRFLNEVITSPDLMLADDSFATSPSMASLFSPASALSDNTSPLFFPGSITPSDLDTPLFDTPSIGPSPADLLTSPALLDFTSDLEFDDMPLFPADDPGLALNLAVAPHQVDASPAGGSNTLSLAGLGTMLPTMSPQLISPSPTSSTSDVPPSRRITKSKPRHAPYAVPSNAATWSGTAPPTGHRRNITSASLIPVNAPTQHRQYYSPSTTSRKDVPAAFAHRALSLAHKRTAVIAGLDSPHLNMDEEGEEEEMGLISAIEAKRRQNTLAARRSRQRKLDHVRGLEELLDRMTKDRDMWKERAMRAEEKIRESGM
jgi:hypothetical protein